MTDQQRWDAVGCVGGWVDTPNIDWIASQGVRFTNAYTNAPVCIPARVSLALGRYPRQHGVRRNVPYTLPAKRQTWMKAVREAGYATSVFGKIHLHAHAGDLRDGEHLVHAYGFDYVDEIAGPRASAVSRSNLTDLWEQEGVYEEYKDDLRERFQTKPWLSRPSPLPLHLYPDVYVGRQAAAYLRGYEDSRPWFCCVSFSGPHEPWDAPEPYASRYDPAAMPSPVEPEDEGGRDRPRGVLDEALAERRVDFAPDDVARLRANYAGNVALIDDQIGEVLRVVRERGELNRTAIAFVSDHGEMNGDYGLLYKGNFLNGSVRIPLVVRLPRRWWWRGGGQAVESPVELMDVGATFVELAGGRLSPRSRARSLLPVLERPSEAHRELARVEHRREVMIATPDWKLGLNAAREVYLLFDLRQDPFETRNLAGLSEYEGVERTLQELLEDSRRPDPSAEQSSPAPGETVKASDEP